MTQKEKNKLDYFIEEVKDWKEGAESRFVRGNAKMDKILSHLVDDPDSTNKGLLTRTNNIEEIIYDLKIYIDQEKRKRTIRERIFGSVMASFIIAVLMFIFKQDEI